MENKTPGKFLDYFPLLAYFGFWFQGCVVPSIMTGKPVLVALGIITTPAMIALVVAAVKIRKNTAGK